jgi:uncharacterized protein
MNIILDRLSAGTQILTADEVVKFEDVDGSENRIECHIELTVRNAPDGVYIHGALRGAFATPCHKCLEPTKILVEPSFELVAKKVAPGSRVHSPSDDDDLIYISREDKEISLDRFIYENLIASMPMRILCREDCKGLCPRCGANLNIETCRCGTDAEPERGAAGVDRALD